jgi:glycosyltransferase involved in cell wall biosynthesis
MDVGVIPSIWAETYGYVGPEMLTRGMPLIVSSAGAMKEYVTSGFNGLVFDPDKPGNLRDCMKLVATDEILLAKLRANVPASEEGLISFSRHVDEMEAVYQELAAR